MNTWQRLVQRDKAMHQAVKKAFSRVCGLSRKNPEPVRAALDEELLWKLGIKPGQKVCLFHAPKSILPLFLGGNLKLTMDWAESDSDVILFWLRPQDDVTSIMVGLEKMIKKSGRIWLVIPKKDIAKQQGFKQGWDEIQQAVLDATSLVDNKTLSIGEGEYGTQFVFRKTAREEAKAEAEES